MTASGANQPDGSVRAGAAAPRIHAAFPTLVNELLHRLNSDDVDWNNLGNMRLLGSLSTELSRRTLSPDNHCSAAKSMTYVRELPKHPDIDEDLKQLRDATCVDVGCGGVNPVGPLFALLLAGAKRGIGVDLDDVASLGNAARALYDCFAAVITNTTEPRIHALTDKLLERVHSFDLQQLREGNAAGIDLSRLSFAQKPLAEAGIEPGSVDCFLSTAFFEHVPDPDEIIATMASLSRPGAYGWHAIDGADHRMYSDASMHALEFLRDPADDLMLHGSNRIRPLAFTEIFERNGFEVRTCETLRRVELSDADIAGFAERYRSLPREWLETTAATFYVRRR